MSAIQALPPASLEDDAASIKKVDVEPVVVPEASLGHLPQSKGFSPVSSAKSL